MATENMVKISEHITLDKSRLDQPIGSDFFVVVAILPFICIARLICERVGAAIFLSTDYCAQKFHRKPHALKLAVKKFEESCWKFVYYAAAAIYGVVFISQEGFLRTPYEFYPNHTPKKVYWYYMVQISFYIWMSFCLMWDVKKKDTKQMATHHGVTLGLLLISYSWQLTSIGSLILLLSDIADPFLELAKMFNYVQKEPHSTITFTLFFLAFVGVRLIIFPIYAIYPSLTQPYELSVYVGVPYVYYSANALLIILFGLNIFWSLLIVRVLVRTLRGSDLKDDRSDVESS